jgi:hypothetical protein
LYTDEDGNEVDVLDLRMMEPIYDRIQKLKILLHNNNTSQRLDSAVLLTAWGIEEGVDYLENFLDRDAIEKEGKYLCRNNKDDCTYDVIGESLVTFTTNNPRESKRVIVPLEKTLSFFGKRSFDNGISSFLIHADISVCLVDNFEKNINSCIEINKICEASEFLVLYAKWGGEKVVNHAIEYARKIIMFPNSSSSKVNVARALLYLPLNAAMLIFPLLEVIDDSAVQFYLDKILKSK